MAGGDGGLQRVRAGAERLGASPARRGRDGRAAGPSAAGPGRASSTGLADGPVRAGIREACSSIRATSPWTSGSSGCRLGQQPAQPQRVLAQLRPGPVVAGGGRVALVEDQVDDGEDGAEPGGQLGGAAAARSARARSASVFLAREMRCPTVGSGTRKARAISRVVQPADRAQGERDLRLGRQRRVAGQEDQPEEVVGTAVSRSSSTAAIGSSSCASRSPARARRACGSSVRRRR